MDDSTVKQSIQQNRYFGDALMGDCSEGDTVYSVMAFPDTNNPTRFTGQDRDTRSEIEDRFESWQGNHQDDLLVLVVFDLEMDDQCRPSTKSDKCRNFGKTR